MDVYDLDPRLLTSAFSADCINLRIVEDLTEWIRNISPSINILTSIFNQHLASKECQFLKLTVGSACTVITRLQDFKCPKIIIRAYLAVIKANRSALQNSYSKKELAGNWKQINVDLLQLYCSTFDIRIQKHQKQDLEVFQIRISQYMIWQQESKPEQRSLFRTNNMIMQQIQSKLQITLINFSKYLQLTQLLFQKMNTSKEASKAANFIKTHQINPEIFTQIGERLNKNTTRYFLKTYGWEVAEQIFQGNAEALACLFQDLIYKAKTQQAISIWYRNKVLEEKVKKQEAIQFLMIQQKKHNQELENSILKNSLYQDYFGPSDHDKFLTLKQFGISQQDVIWIDSQSEQINQLIDSLNMSSYISIDTESVIGKNKLDRKSLEPVSIIQIAIKDKIFLLDGFNCQKLEIKNSLRQFMQSSKLLLGHALQNDINGLLFSVGFTESQIRTLKIKNLVDTCRLFKAIFPAEKYSNLAHISKKILGKQVCKKQTMTNWARRPLRSNQIHYAAMDAFVVIKIFEKMKEEVGEGLMHYFLDLDE